MAESVHRPESDGSPQLPPSPAGTAGFPIAFGSSSLFCAMARDEPAEHVQSLPLASLTGIQIRYTGERLSQRDADVFLHLLARANPVPFGEPVCFTAHSLLRDVGWDTNSRGYARLRDSILRLKANAVECEWMAGRGRRLGFAGSLIGAFAYNDEAPGRTRCEWMISLEPKLLRLFDESSYTLVNMRLRRLLGNRELAKWLYAYLATHGAGACDTRGARVRALCGSRATTLFGFRRTLRQALDILVERQIIDRYAIDPDRDLVSFGFLTSSHS